MNRLRRALAPIGVGLAVGLIALLSIPGTGGASSSAQSGEDAGWALDDIPGFGITWESVVRDDAIAFWEAYKRDVSVRECMSSHGFVWEVEALYPDGAVIEVAKFLGVAPTTGGGPTLAPAARNAQRAAGLSAQERDAYYLALLGETGAAIDYMESNDGRVPPGRDAGTFARGGCRGAADTAGSIWDVPRELAGTLDAFRSAERQSAEFLAAQATYERCASDHGASGVSNPADIDRFFAGIGGAGLDPAEPDKATAELLLRVERDCHAIWEAATVAARQRAGAALRDSVRAVLEQQESRYAGAVEQMRQDAAFMGHLAEESARIAAEMGG